MKTGHADDELDLLGYVAVLWRYGWMIVGLCVLAVVVTGVVSLRTPKVYESTATLLGPRESTSGGALSNLAVSTLAQSVTGLSLPSLTPGRDMMISVLKSRKLARLLVDRLELQRHYGVPESGLAVQALRGATRIETTREGVLAITVEDTDAQMAARLANEYAAELDRLLLQFGSGDASRQRTFIEHQLASSKKELADGEEQLRRFQEKNSAIVLPDQARGTIEAGARLRGEIMAAEVQLQVIRSFATESNPEVMTLRRRIEEQRRQLQRIEHGEARPGRSADMSLPFARVPQLGLQLARLTRDVKMLETVVTLLTGQYEQVKITEAKDLPVVQVLDEAMPAVKHSRPKTLVNVAIAGVAGLLVSSVLALFIDYVRRASSRARAA